jgi:hypothetical protein
MVEDLNNYNIVVFDIIKTSDKKYPGPSQSGNCLLVARHAEKTRRNIQGFPPNSRIIPSQAY